MLTEEQLNAITSSVELGGKRQTFWFKSCTCLMGLFVTLLGFLFLEIWDTNKRQDNHIAKISSDLAVLKSKSISLEKWQERVNNRLERVRYKK